MVIVLVYTAFSLNIFKELLASSERVTDYLYGVDNTITK